ncbi:MAG: hypothetical protein WBH47_18355, partial [Streptosporangiaceae bacterium]
AGSADAGVETLRQAVQAAERAADSALQADVLRALGSALVHAVRGFDGEGTVVLHRALVAARAAASPARTADILTELAFADLQAGRHASAELPDSYVWVTGFVALGELELAADEQPERGAALARRLYRLAVRADLPEFIAWALVHQGEAGDRTNLQLARSLAGRVANPALRARAAAL